MAVLDEKVVCARVDDIDAVVKGYEGMGCTVKNQSETGAFLDCATKTVNKTFYDFETGRDEIWTRGNPQREEVFEAEASLREYYC